jgi:hypothetical protein
LADEVFAKTIQTLYKIKAESGVERFRAAYAGRSHDGIGCDLDVGSEPRSTAPTDEEARKVLSGEKAASAQR